MGLKHSPKIALLERLTSVLKLKMSYSAHREVTYRSYKLIQKPYKIRLL